MNVKQLNFFFHALLTFYQQRHAIAKIYRETPRHYPTLRICPHELKRQGIEILVLDFDGVLAEYGAIQPPLQLRDWLTECIKIFGAEHVFILSNQPSPDRIHYFERHFTGVRFVKDVRKKPHPDGLQKIMHLTQKKPETLMLVDDRLFTGVLAACIAKTRIIYITHPYIDLSKRPVSELSFVILRLLERFIMQVYCFITRKYG